MLIVAFARPEGMFSSVVNKVAAVLTRGQFCHCEIAFSWTRAQMEDFLTTITGCQRLRDYKRHLYNDRVMISFYVLFGTRVSFKFLTPLFMDPFFATYDHHWEQVKAQFSFEEEKRIARFLLSQEKKGYDTMGAWMCWLPLRKKQSTYEKYFCSQLCACALNHAVKMLPNPASLSPNSLYKHLLH